MVNKQPKSQEGPALPNPSTSAVAPTGPSSPATGSPTAALGGATKANTAPGKKKDDNNSNINDKTSKNNTSNTNAQRRARRPTSTAQGQQHHQQGVGGLFESLYTRVGNMTGGAGGDAAGAPSPYQGSRHKQRGSTAHPREAGAGGAPHHYHAARPAVEEGWFVNTVDTVGSGITTTIYEAYISNKPTLVHDAKGIKLGDERFYDDVRFNFSTDHFIRKGIILLMTNPLYKLLFNLLTIVHTASLMVQEPSQRTVTDSADDAIGWAVVVDRFLLFFYGLDICMGLVAHGASRYILNAFRIVDVIVFIAMLGLELSTGNEDVLAYFLAINALRPFRIVSRIRTMKNIVTVVVRTSTTLGDVLILLVFLVGVFGVFSLTVFGPALRSRCYLTAYVEDGHGHEAVDNNWTSLIPIVLESLADRNTSWIEGGGAGSNFTLEGFYKHIPEDMPEDPYSSFCRVGSDHNGAGGLFTPCRDNEDCRANAPAAYTWGGYDNMAASMLTTIQIMTLENWSQSAMDVMDACTPVAALFFLVLTMIGSFWAMNLVLATITKSFETFYEEDRILEVEEQREREKALLQAADGRRTLFLPFINRDRGNGSDDSDDGNGRMLTEALLVKHRGGGGHDMSVVFPNEELGSVDIRSKTPSARKMSSLTDAHRRYVLLLEKGDPMPADGAHGGEGSAAGDGSVIGSPSAAMMGRRKRGLNVLNRMGGKVKSTLGTIHRRVPFGNGAWRGGADAHHLRDNLMVAGGARDGPIPTATSPPETNPYLANPYLRSRWRLISGELSRQSVASMAHLTSVPVDTVATKVMADRRRQRALLKEGWVEGTAETADTTNTNHYNDVGADPAPRRGGDEVGNSQSNYDELDVDAAAPNPFARLRRSSIEGRRIGSSRFVHYPVPPPIDHTRGLDEVLREAAGSIRGTTYAVRDVARLNEGDMNAVYSPTDFGGGGDSGAFSASMLGSPTRGTYHVMQRGDSDDDEDDDDAVELLLQDPYSPALPSSTLAITIPPTPSPTRRANKRAAAGGSPHRMENTFSPMAHTHAGGKSLFLSHRPATSIHIPHSPNANDTANRSGSPYAAGSPMAIITAQSPTRSALARGRRPLAAEDSSLSLGGGGALFDSLSQSPKGPPKSVKIGHATMNVMISPPPQPYDSDDGDNSGPSWGGESADSIELPSNKTPTAGKKRHGEERTSSSLRKSSSAVTADAAGDASTNSSASEYSAFSDGAESASSVLEVVSMRLHTYYDDRLFDGERVRKQFRDFVPRPVYDPAKANGLLRLSVDVDEAAQRAFEVHNRKYRFIIEWRSALDFDELCPADFKRWQQEEGNPLPMTAVDASPIVLGEVANTDSLDGDDEDERNLSDMHSSDTDDDGRVSRRRHRKQKEAERKSKKLSKHNKRRADATGGDSSASGTSDEDGDEEVSSLSSLSTVNSVEPVNLQSKADRIFHIHKQYAQQAMTMNLERKQEMHKQAAKGHTVHLSEQDVLDEKRLATIQYDIKERQDRWAQHAQRQPKDKVLSRIGRRKGSGAPTPSQITDALQGLAEVDARDGGLFAKITVTAQLRAEIKFLEGFIAKELARKTNSTQDMTSKRVRREAKRGFKIHEKRAKTLKGNLLLIMLGQWYSIICKGAVLSNTVLLLFVHYDQPDWLTVLVEVISYFVDVLLIFDCLVRVWLWSPRKYFALTTSHFFAFVEHAVVWFALVDLFALALPAVKVVRVFRVFRFVSSFSSVRRIVKTVQSSIRHLLHIVGFLAIFVITFTVGGWQIFSRADVSNGDAVCRRLTDQYGCDSSPNCVWVNQEQWLTLTNIEFDQMRASSTARDEAAAGASPGGRPSRGDASNSSISRTIFYTEPDSPSFCRQYQGWADVDAGVRFNFGTLFSSFATVFTVVTKDAWTDITYNYMDSVTPFSAIFFLCILFIGGFVLVPLLVAILLVNFEENNNDGDAVESRDAALLDEVRRQLNDLGPENQVIAEQLRLREEKDKEKKRLKALEEEAKASAKAANVAAMEDARRKNMEQQRERARAREAAERQREMDEEAKRQQSAADNNGIDGDNAANVDRPYWRMFLDDIVDSCRTFRRLIIRGVTYLRGTFVFSILKGIFRYVQSFCDRRDAPLEKVLGRSMMVFPADSAFRMVCCDIVGGRYFKYELVTFWVSMLHCVVTPMIDTSIEDEAALAFIQVVNGICVAYSVIDMLLRCIAQCAFLGTYAFFRVNVLNKADFIAVVFSLVASAPELLGNLVPTKAEPYLWAMGSLRPLRVVVRSSSVIKVLEAIWFAVPDMLNVIGVFGGAALLFAVVGVEQFKGTLKTCQDGSDRSEPECVGHWVAKEADGVYLPPGTTGLLMDRQWKNPRQSNFDNSYSAIATLMEVCVASQWGEVLFTIIDTPDTPGGAPARDQNQLRSLYLFFWLVLSNFGLMNIFVGTVVNSFRKYRSMQSDSFFGSETAETRAVKQILEGTTAKKRLTPPEKPFISRGLNVACAAIIRRWWWRRFIQFVMVANCGIILSIHSTQSWAFEVAQFVGSNICAFILAVEMLIKMGIAGPMTYLGLGFNKIQFVVVVLAVVEIILFMAHGFDIEPIRWYRVSWTVRVVALAKEQPNVRRLMRVGVRSLPAMANIGSLLLLLFYIFSICGMAMFQDVRVIPAGRDSLNQNLNFRTFPRAMFTLYRVATLDDWGEIVAFSGPSEPFCSKELGTCGNRTLARFFFTFFVITIAFVMLNLFIAVVLESFELSELIPDNLREREEDVQRFRHAWGKMATGNHLKIHARDFVPLLKELPGPRERLKMLRTRQADDPDFQMSEEEMNFIAKKYAFGLQGEEPQTYIKSLTYLNVPIIMPTQEVLFKDALDVISKLLFNDYLTTDSAAEIGEAVMALRPAEYRDGFTVAHHYCCTRIVSLLSSRKGTKMQYPKWSRFLDPIFREIYERNSTAVIGGGSGGSAKNKNTILKDGSKSAISTKQYSLADYLREALRNNKSTEDDDSRWKGAIRDVVSEGSSDDDSEGSDYCLPDAFRTKLKDDAARAREAIRHKMRLTGETYFNARDDYAPTTATGGATAASNAGAALGGPTAADASPTQTAAADLDGGRATFMNLEDRMVLLQGRQDMGPVLTQRCNRATGGTSQLPTLDELIARRARQRAKAEAGLLVTQGGDGVIVSSGGSPSPPYGAGRVRLRRVATSESIPPYLWRRQLGYDNSIVTGKKAPVMSFFAAVSEASRQAKAGKLGGTAGPNSTTKATSSSAAAASSAGAGLGYKSSLSPELKARIRSALLTFAKDYKASQRDEALVMRPLLANDDAMDRHVAMPSFDELVKRLRRERGQPSEDIGSIMAGRRHMLFSAEDEQQHQHDQGASSLGRYGMRVDDVRVGMPGSVFGHKGTTCLSVPLPYNKDAAGGIATPSADTAKGGGTSASSAVSSRYNWTGGTTRGGRRKQQAVVLEPGANQHELDRLLGILALKKFARRWRERAAAKRLARASAEDPNDDPSL